MEECTYNQLVKRLSEIGKKEQEIQSIIKLAKEYSKSAEAVYLWHKDSPNTIIKCQFIDGIARWFMRG